MWIIFEKLVQKLAYALNATVEEGVWSYRICAGVVIIFSASNIAWYLYRVFIEPISGEVAFFLNTGPIIDITSMAGTCVLCFAVKRQRVRFLYLYIGTSLAIMAVLKYAIIYKHYGIYDMLESSSGLSTHAITHDPAICIYFSIVTWTTLGYGDFVPTPITRFAAATEAILSYVAMAMFVAMAASLLTGELTKAEQVIWDRKMRRHTSAREEEE